MLTLAYSNSSSVQRPIVVPVVPLRGMIDPAIDHQISELARQHDRTNPLVRNALYAAYAHRLHRILIRLWYRNLHSFGCELQDLEQELFLIFATLLERWSGHGSLSAYLHGATPWRLYDAARRLAPRDRPLDDRTASTVGGTPSQIGTDALDLLEELADRLAPFDRSLLLWHVRDGRSIAQIARTMGLSERTVQRAWLRLKNVLRQELA